LVCAYVVAVGTLAILTATDHGMTMN